MTDFDKELAEVITKGLKVSYFDLCECKEEHKMYYAVKMPCTCPAVQEKIRMEEIGKLIAATMLRPRYPRIEDIITIEPMPPGAWEKEKPCE